MRQDRAAPEPYGGDFFAWTQHQAELLRTLERWRADLPPDLDLGQIAEEIEDLGKAELHSVTSLIRQILGHLIKAVSDPQAYPLSHWRTKATTFHLDMLDRYAPSMRQLIPMQKLWQGALKLADAALREHGAALAPDLPAECPFAVTEIVAADFSFDDAVARLAAAQPAA
ncbi:MAG TPA: DUF29 domain-containing protein [Afifellaceae bacterium]|nr:DUF29 domain-containing protein [Afifellaceae bacterium]